MAETVHKEIETLTYDLNQNKKQAVLYFGLKSHFTPYLFKYKKAVLTILKHEKRQREKALDMSDDG